MDFFRRLTAQLRQLWLGMSFGRRTTFVLLIAILIASVAGVGYWASQPDYRVLYSDLSVEDAGAVTAKLQSQNVQFRLTSGGTTILVPAEQVQQLKVDLAMEGLPNKQKGFEVFDDAPLGMTPFMQHVNYGRALETELAKSIMRLNPVAHARVHLVRPEQSPFIREQKPTTASVVLTLKPGRTLSTSMAAGIVALVSHGVEGLSPENVTLLDSNGRILSDQHPGPSTAAPANQLDARRELEAHLASQAEQMLTQLLGPNRAIVRVSAEVNFKNTHEKRETYSPEDRVAKSEKVTSVKSASGPQNKGGGPAGVASNTGTGRSAPTPAPGPNSSEETTETDYAVSKSETELEDHSSIIERLTVAALVDLSRSDEGGQVAPPMTQAEAEEIIKQAVGYKDSRGDVIKVKNVKLFSVPALTTLDNEVLQTQRWEMYVNLVRNASLGVAALVALAIGIMVIRRLRPLSATESAEEGGRTRVLEDVVTLSEQNPEMMARLLARWLEEQEQPSRRAAA
jgi:flagellar M-ring protein FliF